jgi:3-oxoacyl-[acyl-carrier protein] reductase
MRLKNKVALITGAGRGIGRATALRFAEEGARVVVADVEIEVAQEVAEAIMAKGNPAKANPTEGDSRIMTERIGIQTGVALPIQVDVTNRASIETVVQAALARFERIDILVNNAGIVRDAQLTKMSEENFDLVIGVNLKGVFNCTQAVVPTMIKQGSGVILSTASVVAPYGNFGQTNYVASKAGVIGMTKVWARELGRKGIRVNAVAPGFTETRMLDGIPDKVIERLIERIPLGRFSRPEDIANAFLWLASDEAAYVTGHVLAVDGGTVI